MFSAVNLGQRTRLVCVGLLLFIIHALFPIPSIIQVILFALGIVLTGIPHGAMDHLLYLKQHPDGKPLYKWLRFFTFYLGYAALYALLWAINIQLSILLFIAISAYHFGEMDLGAVLKGTGRLEKLIATIYGLLFLFNYLLFRWQEVESILLSFPDLSSHHLDLFNYLQGYRMILLLLSVSVVLSSLSFYYLYKRLSFGQFIYPLLELFLLALITFQLPLLLGFGFYFSAWHALLSIKEIKSALGWSDKSLFYVLKKSWLTNLAALGFILFMLIFFRGDLNRMLAILFMAIAILTAPHIQVISAMLNGQVFQNKRE